MSLTAFALAAAAILVATTAYFAWYADPAWTFTAAVLLSPFAGNWDEMGLPGVLGLDRVALLGAVLLVAVRAPGIRERPTLRLEPVHWFMVLTIAYVVTSAMAVGTLLDRNAFSVLLERTGILPYAAFVFAPLAFRGEHQRRILLGGLVLLGAYLGATAAFEAFGLRGLVFPRYIDNPAYGILYDRARGPFVEPAQNGVGLFVCGGACVVALTTWRARWVRLGVSLVLVACVAGLLFTLTRQVWLGALVAGIVTMIAAPGLRRFVVPALVATAVMIGVALAVVPGLANRVQERREQQATVWNRLNLNTAALNMIEERPLTGFGWRMFNVRNRDYFELGRDYPLTRNVENEPVHNVFLGYATDLGLIGATLWVTTLLLAVGGTLLRRAGPEAVPWRLYLLATFVMFLIIGSFEFMGVFSNQFLWILAGVVRGATLTVPQVSEPLALRARRLAPS